MSAALAAVADPDPLDRSTLEVLTSIYERDGALTAESVLGEAVDPGSPLHDRFEWDDTAAAHQYRLEQARSIVRKVRVEIFEQKVRGFTFLPSSGSYKPVAEVMATVDYRDEVVSRFRREADWFAAKWRTHKVIGAHFKEWAQEMSESE